MSRERPLLAAVPRHEEARWRSGLAGRVRPEFRVERYLPARDHLVLYGPHCSVAGCGRPGNELFVGPARLCQRHARIWAEVRGTTIEAWVAEAPEVRRRSEVTGMPRYDLTSDSPVTRDELRFLLQSLHDGHLALTFNTKRWNALRAVYRERESLLDWDLAQHPAPATVASGSAKRFQLLLLRARRELLEHEPSWRDSVWPRELYAPFDRGLRSKLPAAMDFTCVRAGWLRELAQRVCWTRLSVEAVSPRVAWDMVRHLAGFEAWAGERLDGPESLTRDLLLDYLAHVRGGDDGHKAKAARLTALRTFLDRARIAGAPIASSATYLPGEIEPQREAGMRVRFLDAREVAQLDDPRNLARLREFDRRLYVVLRRTGMRISSAVTLPLDCLMESGGAHYLRFWNTKARGGPREATIPIGADLAAVVREQQQYVRGRFGDAATYLFPARNGAPAGDRSANPSAVGKTLAGWARACGMTASDGSPLQFSPHRLRHTLATEMLNQGVSQRAIQDYLDHSSPEMTAVYAKLLDSTLRAEFDAYQERVNIRGERIAALPDDVPDDAVLLKERISRAKQALPNGYCGLPLQLECPHPNACLSCDAFLTDARFRPVLEQQLERTRELIRVADNFPRGAVRRKDTPKSSEGRSVPMADSVATALERHFQRSAFRGDRDLVFCQPQTGAPLDPSKLRKRFKQALERARVREVTFHELRHTFGTRLAAAGVPLRTIQEWMGHADAKTTEVYRHYAPDRTHGADLIETAFGQGGNSGGILSKSEGTSDDLKAL